MMEQDVGDKEQGHDSTTPPDKWQRWKGKSAIYRARIPSLTPPPSAPSNHNPHSHTPTYPIWCVFPPHHAYTPPHEYPLYTVLVSVSIFYRRLHALSRER
ncbi:unnamed protein product [Macrosiphum euphorbiae]|uniref:Uncharacterized protein n=1 Tax=Macrosiphum euphorbiae TaxID=13131 RepID=A0AAV0XCH4_9HEMI|nr:unnamed protein product [Macrosiphum euphorbiae]